jgi:two-component system response regulator FixJ
VSRVLQELKSPAECLVADDDPLVRDTLALVLSLAGYHVTTFAEGAGLVSAARARTPGCIILDVNMPGRSGLDILKELNAQYYPAPIFMISGVGDIAMAVEAMRCGALDFIEKPFDSDAVVARVRAAINGWSCRAEMDTDVLSRQFPGHDKLTPRERDVLVQIVEGASNKQAGRLLGISSRTVEVHRARILEKVGAKSAADLIRIVLSGEYAAKSKARAVGWHAAAASMQQ